MAQGTLYRIVAAMGSTQEAETKFSTVLPIAIRHLGADHSSVLQNRSEHAKILIQQKQYGEAEETLLEVSRPTRLKEDFEGDKMDQWDALWTLVHCYQRQGKTEMGLEMCEVLVEVVGKVRRGKEETDVSSTFWEMILAKKRELMGMMKDI